MEIIEDIFGKALIQYQLGNKKLFQFKFNDTDIIDHDLSSSHNPTKGGNILRNLK